MQNMNKQAQTDRPVAKLIKERWSPRAFTAQAISKEDIATLFEAARWAPSCNNEQPWLYFYAQKSDQEGFQKLVDCLVPGNQAWAKHADILVACVARKTNAKDGKENPWAKHDLGAASCSIMLQATDLGFYGHEMAGFDPAKATETLGLSEDQVPTAFMALGYLGNPETLPDPMKAKEIAVRERKPQESFVTKVG
jgi:nitroreductase